jgi:hypothetical protein
LPKEDVNKAFKYRTEKRKQSVFGTALMELAASELVQDTMGPIPRLVMECIEAIRSKGLDHVGIFRVPGSSKRIKELKDAYVTQEFIDWEKYTVHDIAGILKAYLRELPDKLLPETLTLAIEPILLVHAASSQDPAVIIGLQCLSFFLPLRYASLLYTLFRFFNELSQWSRSSAMTNHDENNRMTANNLAIVMAPNFFHPTDETMGHGATTYCVLPINDDSSDHAYDSLLGRITCASHEWNTHYIALVELWILHHEHLWRISQPIAERMTYYFQQMFLGNLIGTSFSKKSNLPKRRFFRKKQLSVNDPRHEHATHPIFWGSPGKFSKKIFYHDSFSNWSIPLLSF